MPRRWEFQPTPTISEGASHQRDRGQSSAEGRWIVIEEMADEHPGVDGGSYEATAFNSDRSIVSGQRRQAGGARRWAKLNERQLELLRTIAAGQGDLKDVWSEIALSAQALQSRGLVKLTR